MAKSEYIEEYIEHKLNKIEKENERKWDYRIVKTNKGNYRVQKKVLRWWVTECWLTDIWELPFVFDTVKEAEEYIEDMRPTEIEEIIWYY